MPFQYSTASGRITCPRGDTGALRFTFNGLTLKPGDMLVFGLYNPTSKQTILRKQVEIVDGAAQLLFTNADTRDLPAGSYKYNLRIVTDPEYDDNGSVVCADNTDNVMSIYNDLPKFELLEAGVHV